VLLSLALTTACRRAPLADLTTCVPSDTVMIAGVDLARLRASPDGKALVSPALDSFSNASYLVAAYNGSDLLLLQRANSAPGTTRISSEIAAAGSESAVHAAIAQYRTSATGVPDLLAHAPANAQIWAVARGGVALPLSGNAANLNRLFRFTDFVSLSATVDRTTDFKLTAHSRTAGAAQQFEETLRAVISIAQATRTLGEVPVTRKDLTVTATLSTDTESAARLLRQLLAR
jgi:hypothetical protein